MAAVLYGYVWLSKKKENICIGTELKCFSIVFGKRGSSDAEFPLQ